jgi:hypothetical protein
MSTGAIIMLLVGAGILYGGLGLCMHIALRSPGHFNDDSEGDSD